MNRYEMFFVKIKKHRLACVSPINPNELSLINSFSAEITISIMSFDVSISAKASFKHSDFNFNFNLNEPISTQL